MYRSNWELDVEAFAGFDESDLRDELDYQLRQPADKREIDYAQDLMTAVLKAFDGYLKLAPPDQLRTARTALNME